MMPILEIKYSELSKFPLAQAVQKVASFATDGRRACRIRRLIRELEIAREKMHGEYKDQVIEKYAKRDAEGKIEHAEGDENGFQPDPEKMADFEKANTDFGTGIAKIEAFPLNLDTLEGMKLSAQDLQALGVLFFDDAETEAKTAAGPGIPQNVKRLR